MVYFLINNHFIENDYNYNNSYFTKNNIIPINIKYFIKTLPYYENSRYFLRSFFLKDLYNTENYNNKKFKPIITNNRISNNFYNIKKGPGKILDYELIPIKANLYNVTKPGYVKYIEIWSKSLPNKINSELTIVKHYNQEIILSCILIEYAKYSNYLYCKWLPKEKLHLDTNMQFINFSDLITYNSDFFQISITLEDLM